jgi:CheY-like chemotaxis protein
MSKTILIIDDEPDIRELVALALEIGTSWKSLAADSASAGLALASEHRPDAILLDVMMPGVDGPETIRRLHADQRTKDIPVVFLTAKVRQSDRERLLALGAAGVLAKPFDPMTMPGELAAILGWDVA